MKRPIDVACEQGHEAMDVWADPQALPACATCGGATTRIYKMKASAVIGDDIPGGLLVPHGICWPDGTPRRFYSHSEIDHALKESGTWGRQIQHVPVKGTDKSPHTVRWVATDTTNYDDPSVQRLRQEEMAAHCGVSLAEYLAATGRGVQ